MKLKFSLPKLLLILLLTAVLTILGLSLFSSSEKEVKRNIAHEYGVDHPQFIRTMGVLLGPTLVDGNKIDTLLNGDEIFPAMIAAIRAAKQTISFETYIYWSGEIGQQFADALAERSKSGVKVHILVDWAGSQKMDEQLLETMKSAGIGFTGGVGIADTWNGHAQDKDHWRDTHYRIEGPVVSQMQAAFTDNWTKVSGDVLHGELYFPPQKPAGPLFAQLYKSSTDGGADSTHLMYLLSIAAATRSIDLSMAYFVPDKLALEALVAAMKRGVKVRILLPGVHTDSMVVRNASRSTWGSILEAGAQIYEFQPTMFHCKVLVVDAMWTSVGSTNFDSRSFRLNDEANLNVLDRDFAARQRVDFENDLKRARRVTHDEWAGRPLTEKAWDHLLGLLGPQL